MPPPTLELLDGERPPVELGEGGELTVGSAVECAVRVESAEVRDRHLLISRDIDGVSWVEAIDGASAQHNGQPLAGKIRLADGDELGLGPARIRYHAGGEGSEDPTAVTEMPTVAEAPQLLSPSQGGSGPLPALPDDFDDPLTQQMSAEEVKRLYKSEPARPAAPAPDGPAPLPPPPVGATPSGPALELPPPVTAAGAKLRASSLDPALDPRIPPPPPPPPMRAPRAIDAPEPRPGADDSKPEEVIEISSVSSVELTGQLGQHGSLAEVSMVESTSTTTRELIEMSEVTTPRLAEASSVEVTRPRPSGDGPTKETVLPPEIRRGDPTTQPSIHSIDVPTTEHAWERAGKFLRALVETRVARDLLLIDLAWAAPFGVLLGWATSHAGGAWPLALAAALVLLFLGTWVASARVAEQVAGLTLAGVRAQLPVGVGADVVAVARLRAIVDGAAAAVAAVFLIAGGAHAGGLCGFLFMAACAMVFDAWLRTAYASCFAAWAQACSRARSFDVELAPEPLARALRRK